MAELTGSEILAKCLKKEGVEDIFYIMGGPMLLAESTCIRAKVLPGKEVVKLTPSETAVPSSVRAYWSCGSLKRNLRHRSPEARSA